jgi:ketosteroid isomerase-like protein
VSALAVVREWIARINRRDLVGLLDMMTEDHTFFVDGERPTVGRAAMERAWRGYFDAFPAYRIFEDDHVERGDTVFVLGHTSGSHVPSPAELLPGCVIWKAVVRSGRLAEWIIFDATPENRARLRL